MSKTTFIFASLFVFATAACTAPAPSEDADTTEDALRVTHGGGGRLGYSCSGLLCTCTGDVDCNDMFSDGVCGDISQCDTTNPNEPVCTCLIGLGLAQQKASATSDSAHELLLR